MNHIARFRSEIASARDAREVQAILGRYTADTMIADEARVVFIRTAAAITPHMDVDLFGYLIGGENSYADDRTITHMLANPRITDAAWEQTIADALGRGEAWQKRSRILGNLIQSLASTGRLRAGGPVASRLRAAVGTNMNGLMGFSGPERLLLAFPEELPVHASFIAVEADLALHPLAGPAEWTFLLDRPHQSFPTLMVGILFANPEAVANPEVQRRLLTLAADSVTKLKVGEVMSRITANPEQTLFWTAAMLGQATKAGKPTPPTFVAFIKERLSSDDLAILLDMPDRDIRMRTIELVGNAPVRGRTR